MQFATPDVPCHLLDMLGPMLQQQDRQLFDPRTMNVNYISSRAHLLSFLSERCYEVPNVPDFFQLTVRMMDKFHCLEHVSNGELWLAALTCLLVSGTYHGNERGRGGRPSSVPGDGGRGSPMEVPGVLTMDPRGVGVWWIDSQIRWRDAV